MITTKHIPKWILGLLALLLVYCVFFERDLLIALIQGKKVETERYLPVEPQTIQLKGQLLDKDGRPLVGLKVKFEKDTYNEDITKKDGKFEIYGVPYDKIDNIKRLLIVCDDGLIDEIQTFDLNNTDKYPERNGWIELGSIKASTYCNSTNGNTGIEKTTSSIKIPEPVRVTPLKPTPTPEMQYIILTPKSFGEEKITKVFRNRMGIHVNNDGDSVPLGVSKGDKIVIEFSSGKTKTIIYDGANLR